jgi:hypothetical protein
MFIFDDAHDRPNNSGDSFIGENLSVYQAEWLRSQSEALGQTRTEILDRVLEEWFAIHAPDVWKNMQAGEMARHAVGEFIFRHHEEFLPVSSSAG